MCGIAGIAGDIAAGAGLALVRAMCDAMTHRGPDGAGEYAAPGIAMGMRRLSIIDLAHGWQPLRSADGKVVAFQNGEIYNYRELRRELESRGHAFTTESDTETLAHGYSAWGIDGLLRRIDGMFAIAIFDEATRTLHLARDRFGEKPLYLHHGARRLAYASDLRLVAALPGVGFELEPAGLDRYLAMHFVPGERTLVKGITRVLPGERVEYAVDTDQLLRARYYELADPRQPRVSDRELEQMLDHAVGSRLVADVPVGVFLSGGLDSSLVAVLAARHQPEIATFSMGFESAQHDESEHARAVATLIRSRHHHFTFRDDSFRDLLPKVAAALDEPVGDQATLPLYWLAHEASQHVRVALAGEGADEIFAGYGYYGAFAPAATLRARLLHRWRTRGSTPGVVSLLSDGSVELPSGFPLLTDMETRRRLLGERYGADTFEQDLERRLAAIRDPLQRASVADVATWLSDDLLVKFDRMAMAHSLEGRAPFLEPRLAEAGIFRLPPERRMRGRTSKVALRAVAARLLPESITARRKQGFVLPMARWLRDWLEAAGGAHAYFTARPVPGLDMEGIARLVEDDLASGLRRERLLFALVLLLEWHAAARRSINTLSSRMAVLADAALPGCQQ